MRNWSTLESLTSQAVTDAAVARVDLSGYSNEELVITASAAVHLTAGDASTNATTATFLMPKGELVPFTPQVIGSRTLTHLACIAPSGTSPVVYVARALTRKVS